MKRILIILLLLAGVFLSGRAQKTMNDLKPLPPGYEFSYDHTVEAWYANTQDYYNVFYWVGFTIDTPMRIDVDLSGSKYLSHIFLTLMDRNYNVILKQAPIFNVEPPYREYSHWLLPGTYIIKCDMMRRYALKGSYAPDGLLCFRMKAGFQDLDLEPEPLPEPIPGRLLTEPVFSAKDTVTHHTYIDVQTMLSANKDSSATVRSYYDGLGREIKTVRQKTTPDGNDLWISQEYDAAGRVYKKWLPQTVGWSYEDERPYEFICHEAVPLESPLAHFAAGEAWNNAPVNSDALINDASERLSCAYYLVINDTLHYGGIYSTGELDVMRTMDEDSRVKYDFTNKAGQLVLSRQMDRDSIFNTYYVYDTKHNLRYVLPPAVSTGDVSFETLDRYAYQYKYNIWGKCIWDKKPGCDSVIYAYDSADKLIYSQDGNQRKDGQYTFYLYDIMGREVVKAICTAPELQALPWEKHISERVQGGILGSGYSQGQMKMTPVKLLTVNYYDNYDFLDLPAFVAKKSELSYMSTVGYDERYVNKEYPGISEKGVLTGTCIYTLGEGSSTPALTAMYYDNKGRIVQSRSIDHRLGVGQDYFHYTFTGKILQQQHIRTESGSQVIKEVSHYTYDSAERLIKVTHQLNDGKTTVLSANEYDELCRLKKSVLNNDKQPVEYAYNIRNWLTDIKSSLFTQTLHYNEGTGVPYYNGNISSMTWKAGSDPVSKGYKFTYDGLSRMKDAKYGEGNDLSANLEHFNEQVTEYDKMGNILGLKRYGQISENEYGMIDNLHMTYEGNLLKTVQDSAPNPAYANDFDFKDGASLSVEYFYDANGNLIQDLNKKITSIQYNCLNLPCRIEFEDGNSISYLYDANGTKLRATHIIDGVTTITDYCGDVIYENEVVKTLLTEVGYVSLRDGKYHYYLKDHQGNNRIVFDEDGKVEERNDYYPFGGLMTSSIGTAQPYKYNGKELDRKGGLDWYDYGARHYDAALGRFITIDPLAESTYFVNPYTYCLNNPFNRVDPSGLSSHYNWDSQRYEDERGNEVAWESVQQEYGLDQDDNSQTETKEDEKKYSPLIPTEVSTFLSPWGNSASLKAGLRYTEHPFGKGYFRTKSGKYFPMDVFSQPEGTKLARKAKGLMNSVKGAKNVTKVSRVLGNTVGIITTGISLINYMNEKNVRDAVDILGGVAGLLYWEAGVVYLYGSVSYDTATMNSEQMQENLKNGVNPMRGTFNFQTGRYEF
ncbi:RHS repeat-associated core domain-containing protein [uncultured Bacteroides sp.]|uniref:RHS repeat-associated core domain-containing protein n=1 Tax=uncultured Bacteroides sp. TaxID=162156 RepID=UPI0025E5D4B0|nr:RHS repeat-associated core domain-containing protein [uncultured Bacteroides sp.]